jgi:hypothetical protein
MKIGEGASGNSNAAITMPSTAPMVCQNMGAAYHA